MEVVDSCFPPSPAPYYYHTLLQLLNGLADKQRGQGEAGGERDADSYFWVRLKLHQFLLKAITRSRRKSEIKNSAATKDKEQTRLWQSERAREGARVGASAMARARQKERVGKCKIWSTTSFLQGGACELGIQRVEHKAATRRRRRRTHKFYVYAVLHTQDQATGSHTHKHKGAGGSGGTGREKERALNVSLFQLRGRAGHTCTRSTRTGRLSTHHDGGALSVALSYSPAGAGKKSVPQKCEKNLGYFWVLVRVS